MKNRDKLKPGPAPSRTAERLIFWIMVLFFVGFAWSVLLAGGVSISGKRGGVSYMTGYWALAIVAISLFAATLSSVLLIKVMGYGRRRAAVLLSLILVPPAVFVLRMVLEGQIGI
jgi:hypothetical protein